MTSSERIDCNPGVTRRLKSPPKPGQKSVFLAERFPSIPDGCEELPLAATSGSLPVTPEATGSSPVHPANFRQGSRQLAELPSCVSRMSPSRPPTSRRLPERTSRNRARQIPCTPALPASAIVCRLIRDDRVEASPALPSARLRAPGRGRAAIRSITLGSWRVLAEISSLAPPTPGRVGIGPEPLHDRSSAPGQVLWDLQGRCWANRHPALNQGIAGSHPTRGATLPAQ